MDLLILKIKSRYFLKVFTDSIYDKKTMLNMDTLLVNMYILLQLSKLILRVTENSNN